jgi:hypothetical protein
MGFPKNAAVARKSAICIEKIASLRIENTDFGEHQQLHFFAKSTNLCSPAKKSVFSFPLETTQSLVRNHKGIW